VTAAGVSSTEDEDKGFRIHGIKENWKISNSLLNRSRTPLPPPS